MNPHFQLHAEAIFFAKDNKLSTSLWPSAVFDSTNNIKLRYYVSVKILKLAQRLHRIIRDGSLVCILHILCRDRLKVITSFRWKLEK